MTYALQVYVPDTYQNPSDMDQLGTVWLGYIPTDQVDTLSAEIKAKQSAFYTGTTGISAELAARVVSSFSLNSVPDPQSSLPGVTSPQSASSNSSLAKARQDAIIAVVSTLGASALIILGVLVYRSYQRRRELAHHRLSGTEHLPGLRPQGREFDEDSVGGQRRRSFYYAEDSLRGFENERSATANAATRVSPTQMGQRRIIPATISAPILTESSMNW
jgi:hypothetical protein